MQRIAGNWREWVTRYGWAEAWGILTSYLGFFAGLHLSGSPVVAAFFASMGENVGYYGCIIWREIAARRRLEQSPLGPLLRNTARDLLYEFGLPELLDSLIVRPATTYLAVALFGPGVGVFVAKVASDAVFYALAISLYERRKARDSGS